MNDPRLPEFVVLGQGKAGTSLIYRVLEENPLIGLSQPKELHYFNAKYDRGLEWYAEHFAHVPPEVPHLGEVSPAYLSEEALPRVAETLGRETRVIFVLRRPIEQTYSRYLQNICASEKGGTYNGARFLARRLAAQLETIRLCYGLFGADRVLLLFYEIDITPFRFEARILSFLGLPPADHSAPFRDAPKVNSGVMPRYLYGGEKGSTLRCRGEIYRLEPGQLVFCGQPRNTRVQDGVAPAAAARALARQSRWSSEVTAAEYARMQAEAVLPAAERLEAEFGFDMSHWRNPPRRIAYDPAPPPAGLLKKEKA